MFLVISSGAARISALITLALLPWTYQIPDARAQTVQPLRFTIAVKARLVEPAMRTLRARQGDSIELAFSTDEPLELHLHGYDLTLRVEPGKAAALKFQAKLAGRFPIEAHAAPGAKHRHANLLYLEVYPR
jgi:hypothetical protein